MNFDKLPFHFITVIITLLLPYPEWLTKHPRAVIILTSTSKSTLISSQREFWFAKTSRQADRHKHISDTTEKEISNLNKSLLLVK